MLASALPSSTAAAPAGLGLGLLNVAGAGAAAEEGAFGALFQRAALGWALPPAEALGSAAAPMPEAQMVAQPSPVPPPPSPFEAPGDAGLSMLAPGLMPAAPPAAAPPKPPPGAEAEAPEATVGPAMQEMPLPMPSPLPVAQPAPPLIVPAEPASFLIEVAPTPAIMPAAALGSPAATAPDLAAPDAVRPETKAAAAELSAAPETGATFESGATLRLGATPESGVTAAPGALAEVAAMPLEWVAPKPLEPVGPRPVPAAAAPPQPDPGKPRLVTLVLPPGVVPRPVATKRPTDGAVAELVPPAVEASPTRAVFPAATQSLRTFSGLAAANTELRVVPSPGPELGAHASVVPVAPTAGKTEPAAAIPLVEQAAPAGTKPHEPWTTPAAVQVVPASEPAHVPPPSPTRQVLPLTIAMLISPGTSPTLTVTLEPGEMGRVEIRVGRDAEGTTLRLIAERPETAALMQRDSRELQQGLAQSGIRLDAAAIQFETAGGGTGQPRDRQPSGEPRRPLAMPAKAEPDAPLSLLDMRI